MNNAMIVVPKNYMIWSVLITLFWCFPVGLIALYYSIQVNFKAKNGQFENSYIASKRACFFCWFGFLIGLLFSVSIALFTMVGYLFT